MASKIQAADIPSKLFIGNEYVDATSKETLTLVNPFDDSIIPARIQTAGREDVDAAVAAAQRARRQGPWTSFSGAQRQACLLRFADLVEKNADRLAALESLPSGKPVTACKMFDIAHMVQVYRYYAGLADKINGDSYPEENGVYKIVRYEPLGVCAGVASWNATFMYVGWKIAPALAAGNCFIFKASEKSPLGALALGPLFAEAGFPPGVVQFVSGAQATGEALASHPEIAKISFTGGASAGRAIQELALKSNMKRVTLELGGKSPAIVFDDASFDPTVQSVGGGFLANSGQICVAASRVIVQDTIADKFIAAVKSVFESASKSLGSDPQDPSTELGPVVDKGHFDRIMSYVEIGKQSATLLTGGCRKGAKGQFIEPTIFVNPRSDSRVLREEIFGPVLTIQTFKTEEEAVALANDSVYGLAACIYTNDLSRALRVSSKLESGGVSVNSPYLPELNTPFGGIKQSGSGRELGKYGLYEYLEPKSVHINLNFPPKL
ncbi:putative aldehyde dehydrogenase protein [Neofusicoccum parvum UCRNP2]|uniref:aldehyde dehydrogenase (NAD(+)) n=1 Tax=Botryosphaeria parva (strain UCR-NP2) TaxID=1287680 RepID=R1GIY4_BOTPV|nr:putative aldehyde dehydrogenase protein [Neofusicoccum parvum UCRNP2]